MMHLMTFQKLYQIMESLDPQEDKLALQKSLSLSKGKKPIQNKNKNGAASTTLNQSKSEVITFDQFVEHLKNTTFFKETISDETSAFRQIIDFDHIFCRYKSEENEIEEEITIVKS